MYKQLKVKTIKTQLPEKKGLLVNEKYIKIGRDCFISSSAILGHKSLSNLGKPDARISLGFGSYVLSGAVIYEGARIGKHAIIGHNAVIREHAVIGQRVCFWNNVFIDYNSHVGSNVKIHYNTYVAPGTIIEDDVFLGPGVVFANVIHPGCKFLKKCMKGPVIKKGAQVGANVTVNPYVTIGEKAIIGSGSVVTKNIPKGCFAYGNPAVVKGSIYALKCKTAITNEPYKK